MQHVQRPNRLTLPLLAGFAGALLLAAFAVRAAGPASPATVHKAKVEVHSAPDFQAPTVATLKQDDVVQVSGQQGLWFQVTLPQGTTGFVRVNDVRMQYASTSKDGARALFDVGLRERALAARGDDREVAPGDVGQQVQARGLGLQCIGVDAALREGDARVALAAAF